MISLGAVVLADGLVWAEEFQAMDIVQEVRQTLGGAPKVYSGQVKGPYPITLQSLDDQGWQKISVARQLLTMAKSGGQYTLVLGAKTYTVEFRHYEAPVLEVQPLIPRSIPLDDDFCLITLKLVSYLPL